MEVEADPHETLLAGANEETLAIRRALEQQLALVDDRHRSRRRREVGVRARDRLAHSCDDRRARDAKPSHHGRSKRPPAEQAHRAPAPQRGPRRRPGTPAFGGDTDREKRLERPVVRTPERCLARDAEQHEEPKLDLTGDERRKLDQKRVRTGGEVRLEARRLERLVSALGQCLEKDSRVVLVEEPLGRQRDERARDVGPDGEAVRGVAPAAALERDDGTPMGRLEEGVRTRGGVGEKAPVCGVQPSGGAGDGLAWDRRRPVSHEIVSGRRCHRRQQHPTVRRRPITEPAEVRGSPGFISCPHPRSSSRPRPLHGTFEITRLYSGWRPRSP